MIKVLFFAGIQERAGTAEIQLEEANVSISEIKMKLEHQYESPQMFKGCLVALNEEYADDEAKVKSGDTVAFIPPVSGG